jgi:hypothetical protein
MAREIFRTAKPLTRARSRETIADIARSGCDAAVFADDAFGDDRALKSAQVVEATRTDDARTLSRDFWQ